MFYIIYVLVTPSFQDWLDHNMNSLPFLRENIPMESKLPRPILPSLFGIPFPIPSCHP